MRLARRQLVPLGILALLARGLWGPAPAFLQAKYALPALDQVLAQAVAPLPGGSPLQGLPARPPFPAGLFGLELSGGVFLLVETALLLVLEFSPESTLSNFAARKICHSGTGVLMLTLGTDGASLAAVLAIAVGSLLMTWNVTKAMGILPFRFGAERDIGITLYLCIVMAWFHAGLPPAALSSLFFADPAGAVVGKFLSRRLGKRNAPWYQQKTVGGSVAVFVMTFLSLALFFPPMSSGWRLALSALAVVAEGVGGAYDNLCQAGVVLFMYYYVVP